LSEYTLWLPLASAFIGSLLGPTLLEQIRFSRSKKSESAKRRQSDLQLLHAASDEVKRCAIDYWSNDYSEDVDCKMAVLCGEIVSHQHACSEIVTRLFRTSNRSGRDDFLEARRACISSIASYFQICTGGDFLSSEHKRNPNIVRHIVVANQKLIQTATNETRKIEELHN
jgi:hypothetical protein